MASTYTPLATTTLGSAAASYTFSSIPSTYTDLVAVISFLTTGGTGSMYLNFNGDTGSNYSAITLEGNGSGTISQNPANRSQAYVMGYWGGTYTGPYTSIINIQNYSNTTTYKTLLSRGASSTASAYVNLWRSTSAINSITFTSGSGNFDVGTSLTLFGIKAA